ncbi:MAG: efflux transporter outer membrane subunit [Pseudomonadales bacterium]
MRHLSAVFALLLGGCAAVGPDYQEPSPPPLAPDQPFTSVSMQSIASQQFYLQQAPVQAWWLQLRDPTLTRLIEQALVANTDLRVAMANLNAARALLKESRTGLQPSLDLEAGAERSRPSAVSGQPTETRTISSASLGLAWELDVFGRVRRSIEAAQRDFERNQALQDDVKRIVIADVASAYFDLRGAQERRKVVERNINNQRETLELTQTLAREGIASHLDTTRARAQLTATQALLPITVSAENAALNRLARLTGRVPGPLDVNLQRRTVFPALPTFTAVGDPASLIRRRPDIREAERALAGLTAQVGVATADLFPTVRFAASYGVAAASRADLDNHSASNYSLGPGIVWNLFNRSAIRARIAQAEANAEAQLARYDGVVLAALEEVNTALMRHAQERLRYQTLQESVVASRESVELVKLRYNAGAESFLDVLDAERTLLDAERELTASKIDFAQQTINLYRALGGL